MSITGKELKRQLLGDYTKTNHVINDTINRFIKDKKMYPKVVVSTPQHKAALMMKFVLMSQMTHDAHRVSLKT